MSVVTRFAPSPTGYLHIGGARTALFNWLFARKMGGRYLLRIEDTDRARSTPEAIEAIVDGLAWLGLEHDGEITFQFARAARHREVAEEMVRRRTAFLAYETTQELAERAAANTAARAELTQLRTSGAPQAEIERKQKEVAQLFAAYRSPYRDEKRPPPAGVKPVVRLRAPDHEIVNDDMIQGRVAVRGDDLDDLVLLRADGTPTYMLSVVVDDHDMGVTHVIRGDDHLTNAARQIPIYAAMGWTPPKFAHVPLIHGQDGAKLSKRHGAPEVQTYREMGYLPEAMIAYLMRLGWSPGHDDILTKEEAIGLFDIAQIGKAPARLDLKKLDSVNAHFLAIADDARVMRLLLEHLQAYGDASLAEDSLSALARAVPVLKRRARTVADLAQQAAFVLAKRPLALDEAAKSLIKGDFKHRLARLRDRLAAEPVWEHGALASALKAFATDEGVGLGQIGPGLRAALTGGGPAPDLGQTLEFLGREEALARIADQI